MIRETTTVSSRAQTPRPLLVLALALLTVLSLAAYIALGVGGSTTSDRGALRLLSREGQTPNVRSTAPRNLADGSPSVLSEAQRLHRMDPTELARTAASEDAAAKQSGSGSPVVKGVWRVGKVGTYSVGKGIAPGTYESAGATEGTCRWARKRDLSGKATDVIQKGAGAGKNVVTIRSSDAFFETVNCQNWHKVA